MDNIKIYALIGTLLFGMIGVVSALYAYNLSKQFSKIIKAKVTRIESLEDGKFRYHFEGKSNGRRILDDVATYKEKKFKIGEKVSVRMDGKSGQCHSNLPIWPIFSALICVFIAVAIPLAVFTRPADSGTSAEGDYNFYQETGYFIVTDSDTFIYGDNLGLTKLDRTESYISTGDYGSVYFMGQPKYESGSIIPYISSIGANIDKDGTSEDVSKSVIKQVENMGYKINTTATDSATIIESELATEPSDGEHDHEHAHDATTPGTEGAESPDATEEPTDTEPSSQNDDVTQGTEATSPSTQSTETE